MDLKNGRPIYWPDVTLSRADAIYATGAAGDHLQLNEDPPKPKKKSTEDKE